MTAGASTRNATNTYRFEEGLSTSASSALLNAVDTEKGRFLLQLDRALGGSQFDLLQDSNRVQGFPLLQLDDRVIMARPDCDPRWIEELRAEWNAQS